MPKQIKISFDGIVGEGANTAAEVRAALRAGGPVAVAINSPGGIATEGLAIYNLLKAHAGRVDVTVDALAASAASLIAMAGDSITMREGSLMMIHDPAGITIGTAAAHEKSRDVLNKMGDQFAKIYAQRSGQSEDEARALMLDETWMDSSEAIDLGFASAASDKRATANAPTFDYRMFKHAPATLLALSPPQSKRKTPMAKKPATVPADDDDEVVVDVTGDILNRAATAKLSAAEAAEIVLLAKGSLDKARDLIIDKVAANAGDQRHAHSIRVGEDAGGDEAGFADAMADQFQAKLQGRPATGAGKIFNGSSNLDLAKEFLKAHSISLRARDPASILGAAFKARRPFMSAGFETTSDLSSLLGDGMNRELTRLFAAAEPGVVAIAGAGQLSDYREAERVATTSFPSLEKVLEAGEITWSAISDHGEKIRVANYARAVAVSIEVLTNDSLQGVQRAIRDISVATQNLRAKLVIDALTTTTMSDGFTLIDDANHGNVVDEGAPSVPALSAMRSKMRLQKSLDGTTVLGLTPSTILVPAALETQAEIIAAAIAATSVSEVNPFTNLKVAVDPRLDAIDNGAWYVAADASIQPAIELATLTSTPTPRLEVADPASFDRLGTAFRVWFAVGAAPLEFRSIVKNTGNGGTDD
ncbi:MAG: head maturation protease, ClpP-related [Bauldia sp.]